MKVLNEAEGMNINVERLLKKDSLEKWIDDPVLTRGEGEPESSDTRSPYQSAADIADVTALPMHHPDSKYLRYGADLRTGLFMSTRMFVMQVAHPQVGAGVGQLSNFKNDPWHRLREITKSGEAYIFSGRDAGLEEGRRLRELHRDIKGIDNNGKAYHSLNPKTYGWVHLIFLDSIITMHQLYGEPLSRREQQELFLQWQEGGRVFGLRDKDMPRDIDEYYLYYNYMIQAELEYNDVIDFILDVDKAAPENPLKYLPEFVWQLIWKPLSRITRDYVMYALPPKYREKISEHQAWSELDQKRMAKKAKRIRFIFKYLPEKFSFDPKGYAAMTAKAPA